MTDRFPAFIILGVLLIQPGVIFAHGDEKHGEKVGSDGMSMQAVKNGMDMPQSTEFIRWDAPTGNSVVLGRANHQPVLEPELVSKGGKKVKVFRLTVKDIKFEVSPGKKLEAFAFNGIVPGPVIRVTVGDRVRVILTNDTNDGHTIHFHGQPKPLNMDGVPYLTQQPVEKGKSFTYEFTVKQSGTTWYHCHVDSAHHVDMGMYGAFIVDPNKEKLKYDREYTLILDEWPGGHEHGSGTMSMNEHQMDNGQEMSGHGETPSKNSKIGEMSKSARAIKMTDTAMGTMSGEEHGKGDAGMVINPTDSMDLAPQRDWYPKTYKPHTPVYDTFTINGRAFPYTQPLDVREGEQVRIRIINAGYEQHYMHSHSHRFEIVAQDGNPVKGTPQVRDTVAVGPGQRVDIILTADNPGVWPFHCHNLLHVANDNIYPGGMLTFLRYVD